MSSSPVPQHLDNHHRNTLRQIFQHPASHNIEWHAVTSLLEAVGTGHRASRRQGHRHGRVADPDLRPAYRQGHRCPDRLVDLRNMLSQAGYDPHEG